MHDQPMRNQPLELIAFDADDTLWHNETLYAAAQASFKQILAPYADQERIAGQLLQTELRNLEHFGFGIKGFVLSMIETAIQLSDGRLPARQVQQIIDLGRDMLRAEIQLFEQVEDTVAALSASFDLMIITKGDLMDQENKVSRSGLAPYFKNIEILSHKTAAHYRAILAKQRVEPDRFLMVGNSLKSDILPVLEIGGAAVYIPHSLTWAAEHAPEPAGSAGRYFQIDAIGELPELLERLNNK